MPGEDFSATLTYHEATKHSEVSVGAAGHYLDWDNKPAPFKEYENLSSIALPRSFPHPTENSLLAIEGKTGQSETRDNNLEDLAEILFFSGGLTRKVRFGRQSYFMRAASATGALYPIELYVITGRIDGLEAGVYHFNPLHFSLVKLRDGDYRTVLVEAGSLGSLTAPFTLALTSLAWRNAWKYEARSYRHWFWDSGVIAANLLAITSSMGHSANLELGFVDAIVDKLLGLEPRKEATIALATIGQGITAKITGNPRAVGNLDAKINPLSREEVDYPIIWETNEASQLKSQSEVDSWKKISGPLRKTSSPLGPAYPLQFSIEDRSPPLDKVILLRGSTRRFSHDPISIDQLSAIIQASAGEIPLDFLDTKGLIDFYFIANAVTGLPAGSYFYDQETKSVEQLRLYKNRSMSGYLCLGQQLFSDASLVFFLMTDLESVLKTLGNRGYRAAQFEAGIRAGRIYLSSYAVGIGASGSTFFDDAVTEFLSPHAKDKSPMIAVGVGVPAYKARPGRILPQLRTSA